MIDLSVYRSFRDELTKIAEESVRPKKEDTGKKIVRGVIGGHIAPSVALAGQGALHEALAPKVLDKNLQGTAARTKEVAKQMGVKDFNIVHNLGGPSAGDSRLMERLTRSGKIGPHREFVNIPKGTAEATIAHEIGHIKNMRRFGKAYMPTQLASRNLARIGSPLAGIYSAASEDPSYKPAVANLAVSSPFLADEAVANVRGAGHMVKNYGWRKGLGRSKHLLPAMGTYATLAGAPLAITAIRKHLKKRDEVQKTAARGRKLKKKQSGEVTLDRSHFVQELDNSTKTPDRGPHPALNLEHSGPRW